ncbi:MAG: tetratricopeptide repeat protein [Gemmatimonadetes bacterium]|nr:tetratricopeptide repeat protein [Gemmatimonadota bacterium]NIO31013.1 tetratricopeptide repeat protein [Gemmatimonadota bacterium]
MRRKDLLKSMMAMAILLGVAAPVAAAPQVGTPDEAIPEVGSFYQQDPADQAYRLARERLNQGEYRRAAEMFAEVYRRYPSSSYAAQALYYQAFALYRNGRERDLRAAAEALSELRSRYADSELARRDADELLARIEGALARRGDSEAAASVVRAAQEPCAGEDEIRIAALNALLQMNSERALPILERVLADRSDDACSVEMRRKAVFLLSQHVDEENVDLLLDIVQNDPDPEVRHQAVFWLSQVPGERTVDALENILQTSDDPELQNKAIFSLSQVHSDRAGQILRDFAMREGADPELRGQAIFWLGQSHAEENAEFLREIYASADEYEIKEKIIFSLSQLGDDASASWLLEVAGDANEPMEMRKKALFWAGQSHVLSIDEVGELYNRMPERELRGQIIFAMSQRHEDESVDWLLEIARTEEDVELKKKAIFWLSQSDDPRVAEFLLQLIEGGGS